MAGNPGTDVTDMSRLNPLVKYQAHTDPLSTANAESIIANYDLVLDCTDHPTSRYLISDACVLLAKPLVSASAFQTSGQLVTLNSPPGKGPCYRCVFPRPPPPESVVGCGEGGIVGGVVGVMGVLQALEGVKLIVGGGLEDSETHQLAAEKKEDAGDVKKGVKMLLFSGWGDMSFRVVRMKGKREDCFACGKDGITKEQLRTSLDYVQFCGVVPPVNVLSQEERVSPGDYHRQIVERKKEHVLLDVREREHFDMCHMKNAVNLPFSKVVSYRGEDVREILPVEAKRDVPLYVVCQRGNDSQVVVRKLKDAGMGDVAFVGDIQGGTKAWKDDIDPTMPFT